MGVCKLTIKATEQSWWRFIANFIEVSTFKYLFSKINLFLELQIDQASIKICFIISKPLEKFSAIIEVAKLEPTNESTTKPKGESS